MQISLNKKTLTLAMAGAAAIGFATAKLTTSIDKNRQISELTLPKNQEAQQSSLFSSVYEYEVRYLSDKFHQIAIGAIAVLAIGGIINKFRTRAIRKGEDYLTLTLQQHLITENEDGSKSLVFRDLGIPHSISKLIDNPALGDEYVKFAKKTDPNLPLVPLRGELGKWFRNTLFKAAASNNSNSSLTLTKYLMFITCEDPQVKNKEFYISTRLILITHDELKLFTDRDFIRKIRVEKPHHKHRVKTLYQLAKAYFGDNQLDNDLKPRMIEIPTRKDWRPTNVVPVPDSFPLSIFEFDPTFYKMT